MWPPASCHVAAASGLRPRRDSLDLIQKFEVSLASLRVQVRWTTTGYSRLHWRRLDPSASRSASSSEANVLRPLWRTEIAHNNGLRARTSALR